ncbi:MAG: flavodoxin domain-containing protein [Desulforhopalus sp.]
MSKILIVYASMNGETEKIGELIAEGLRFAMVDVTLKDVKDIKNDSDLAGYDGYLFGSSTYHGEMMSRMKTFLFQAKRAELQGKKGGAFGAYGWSGEAAERIFDTMQNICGMEMVGAPLMLKAASIGGGIKMAHDYGKEIAAMVQGE